MPGDVVPTAATLSPTPIACSALTACGLVLTAAPISPKAGAVSKTSAFMPNVCSAFAAASPARPPPTIAILQLDGIRSSSTPPLPSLPSPSTPSIITPRQAYRSSFAEAMLMPCSRRHDAAPHSPRPSRARRSGSSCPTLPRQHRSDRARDRETCRTASAKASSSTPGATPPSASALMRSDPDDTPSPSCRQPVTINVHLRVNYIRSSISFHFQMWRPLILPPMPSRIASMPSGRAASEPLSYAVPRALVPISRLTAPAQLYYMQACPIARAPALAVASASLCIHTAAYCHIAPSSPLLPTALAPPSYIPRSHLFQLQRHSSRFSPAMHTLPPHPIPTFTPIFPPPPHIPQSHILTLFPPAYCFACV